MNYRRRQQAVEERLNRFRADAFLVTHMPNVRYLCGFTGSSGALLLPARGMGRPVFFTDGRYTEQAKAEVQRARIVVGKQSVAQQAGAWVRERKWRSLGLEADHVTLAARGSLRQVLGGGIRLRELRGWVEGDRMVKEPEELGAIEHAAAVGASLMKVALKCIRPGVREAEVAAEMEYAARRAGASGMSFDTIVASGPRSALPHGKASDAKIPAKGFIILDFGVTIGGYCSDRTRTVHMGRCTAAERQMYESVRLAQEAAIQATRDGVECGAVDAAARSVLNQQSFGRYFTHSTGHGVGLEIHEPPRLGHGQQQTLKNGMVVTVEPGVYIPRLGGVRIEDMVVVTEKEAKILAPASKELIEL